MNSKVMLLGAVAFLSMDQASKVEAIQVKEILDKQSSASGIFSKMIEVETEGQTAAQVKEEAKKRHQLDMAEAEKEHEQAVREEEEADAKEKKEEEEKQEKALQAAEVQAKLVQKQRLQASAEQDSVAAQLQQQMSTEELQAQAQQQLLEEEARIKSVKPKGLMERAQQAAQLEQSEKATAEALQAMAGAKVSLA